MALKKTCACGKIIDYNQKYCKECEKKYEQERRESNKQYDRHVRYSKDNIKYSKFYHSAEWVKVRQVAIVRDHALCQDCLKENRITPYDTVHHIVPIKQDWDKRLDVDNLVCLCESCHQKRHKELK
ncbi:HNH endonuclease [Tepidibacter thalassicus]|uniref:Putative HNH nuclease YajD n=1 Tax=Tepidibacter thalassicus DSM 15285 TaxID=1123350 RepID=A0A1M5PX90_9FIRM|nr:HNH endonuclease [Tepidibacter thalassicus]SHH06089.1 HNH endonuclease [Tepidibacter thalassicus DSM 15285]